MIHTMDIYYPVPYEKLFEHIVDCVGFTDEELDKLNKHIVKRKKDGSTMYLAISPAAIVDNMRNDYPGFIEFRLFRMWNSWGREIHRLVLRIEPQEILEQKRTVNLFDCSEESKRRLSDLFYDIMFNIFGDVEPNMLELSKWYTSRVDYTLNIHLLNQRNVQTLVHITKNTMQGYRYEVKRTKKEDDSQSTAQANSSMKMLLYDKVRELQDIDDSVDLSSVIAAANGICRVEVQCKSPKVRSMLKSKNKYSPCDRHVLFAMDPKIAIFNIWSYYKELVGFGDFYCLQDAVRKINASSYKPKMKEKLINFIRLGSQVNDRRQLKKAFCTGQDLKSYPGIYVQGSSATYSKYINLLYKLNIHPIPISNKLLNEINTRHFINPLKPINFNANDIITNELPIVPEEQYSKVRYTQQTG